MATKVGGVSKKSTLYEQKKEKKITLEISMNRHGHKISSKFTRNDRNQEESVDISTWQWQVLLEK